MTRLQFLRLPLPDEPVRDRIKTAAEHWFLLAGQTATLRDIAHTAGSNEATVLRLFQSHDHLLSRFLNKLIIEAKQELVDILQEKTPEDRLAVWMALVQDASGRFESTRWQLYRLTAQLAHVLPNPLLDTVKRYRQHERMWLTTLCAEIGAVEPSALADKLLLLADGVCNDRGGYGFSGPERVFKAAAQDLIAAHRKSPEAVDPNE